MNNSIMLLALPALLLFGIDTAHAEQIPELFVDEQIDHVEFTPAPSLVESSLRLSPILTFNVSALDSDRIQMSFFDKSFVLEKKHVRYLDDNYYHWVGNIVNSQHNPHVILSVEDDKLILAHLRTDDGYYAVQHVGENYNIISEVNTSKFPGWGDDVEHHKSPDEISLSNDQYFSHHPTSHVPYTQKVLVAYTNAAKMGHHNIVKLIEENVASANMAYENSNINIKLELVGIQPVNYTEIDRITDIVTSKSPSAQVFCGHTGQDPA